MPPVGSSTCLLCLMHRIYADHPCLVAHNSLFKISLSFCLLFLNMLSLSHSVSLMFCAIPWLSVVHAHDLSSFSLYILWVYRSLAQYSPSPPLTSIPRSRRTNVYSAPSGTLVFHCRCSFITVRSCRVHLRRLYAYKQISFIDLLMSVGLLPLSSQAQAYTLQL